MQDSGRLEDADAATRRGARSGATWKSRREASLRERGCGATRGFNPEAAGRCSIRGNPGAHRRRCGDREAEGRPEASPVRNAGGCEPRGDSRMHRWQSRKIGSAGQPGRSIAGVARGPRSGETRSFAEGVAEGCEIRGDSKLHRRQGRRTQGLGQPETSSLALQRDRRAGATRSFHSGAGPEDAKRESSCGSVAGAARALRVWGNPGAHRRRYR